MATADRLGSQGIPPPRLPAPSSPSPSPFPCCPPGCRPEWPLSPSCQRLAVGSGSRTFQGGEGEARSSTQLQLGPECAETGRRRIAGARGGTTAGLDTHQLRPPHVLRARRPPRATSLQLPARFPFLRGSSLLRGAGQSGPRRPMNGGAVTSRASRGPRPGTCLA